MSLHVVISPAGRLVVEDAADVVPEISAGTTETLKQAFGASTSEGLLTLASEAVRDQLPVSFVFWRDFARRLFASLCQMGEGSESRWAELSPPAREELEHLAADGPPMKGLEYLSADVLSRLWRELLELVIARAAAHREGPTAFLRSVNPLWHQLGRVTFHLAENKRDERHPFAFLATYAHKMSGHARLQHLPLAQALREYAGANDREKLTSLLEPVRRAAEKSKLVRELLDTKQLFQPQAWSISQAYRFLTDLPAMEESGVVVRVPDWWNRRRPTRPTVQVRVGQKAASQVGLDALLDFSVNIALDGEALTAAEQQQLLAGTDGLILEVHPEPDSALSDGPQSLTLEDFEQLMTVLERVLTAVGRPLARPRPVLHAATA